MPFSGAWMGNVIVHRLRALPKEQPLTTDRISVLIKTTATLARIWSERAVSEGWCRRTVYDHGSTTFTFLRIRQRSAQRVRIHEIRCPTLPRRAILDRAGRPRLYAA